MDIVLSSISFLEGYLATLEDFLESESRKNSEMIEQLGDTSEEDIDYYGFLDDEGMRLSYEYPRLLRYSFLVTCHSYLEERLHYFCDYLRKEKELPLSVSDVKGANALERAKKYIKKLAKVEIQNDSWAEILNIGNIRRCIVHSEGRINTSNKKKDRNIQNYIDNRSDISRDSDDTIILTKEYCQHVLDEIRELFKALYSEDMMI